MIRTYRTMISRRGVLSLILASALGTVASSFPAFHAGAQSLDEHRAKGTVGEGHDGFLHLRKESDNARALVNAVYNKRRDVYNKRAREQGVSADQVGRVYSRKILDNAPPGTWFRKESGEWIQK